MRVRQTPVQLITCTVSSQPSESASNNVTTGIQATRLLSRSPSALSTSPQEPLSFKTWTIAFTYSYKHLWNEKKCEDRSSNFNSVSHWPRGLSSLILLFFSAKGMCFYIVTCLAMLSHVWLFVIPRTVIRQAPLSMGLLQAGILEWVAISFSRGHSQPRDQTHISCTDRWILYHWASWEALLKADVGCLNYRAILRIDCINYVVITRT